MYGEMVFMNRGSFSKGLMAFNERVLYLGNVTSSGIYTMQELKEKLFFNRIFIDNMHDVFQKYSCLDIVDDYVAALNQYSANMNAILYQIHIVDPTIVFERESSFEQRLVTESYMNNQLISTYHSVGTNLSFMDNIIYYVSIMELNNDYIIMSYIDPRRSIYADILCKDLDEYTTYWKSDDSILAYVKNLRGEKTVAFKVSTSLESKKITKVEFIGDVSTMNELIWLFPRSALIIENKFMYTDDIKRVIESKVDHQSVEIQEELDSVELDSLFHKDILIDYPTVSFDTYLQFLSLASTSNRISSIRLSLYRIGDDPIIYYILRNAIEMGIYVHVNIELYASGEDINSFWIHEMKSIGIHVTTYAAGRLKVHSKLTLIEFKNKKCVAQIGTGNYHTQTTTQYTDLSLITSNMNICRQVRFLFEIFDGSKEKFLFNRNLLVTRYNSRRELIRLINEESNKSKDGYICIKCNILSDPEMINTLNEAAKCGCKIDLIIRGVCTWVPCQLGYNVKIKSIVWDKLEHSRVYCFGSCDPIVYIGSLDLSTNKLDRRIETLVKISDPDIIDNLCSYINQYITNSKNSWVLTRSGKYRKENL